ncbi:MAG TPA: hypothetical protein VES21_03545, partial [Nocardioidaceae bacterium]|nr:hypothetical protein [Nocardioidaceae bacterium]
MAELPTCQKTLQADAPLTSDTVLPGLVINEDPAWKMNTAFGSPCASKVRVPVKRITSAVAYTPETNVSPLRSPGAGNVRVGVREKASLYAGVHAARASLATLVVSCVVPSTMVALSKPVMDDPGLTPTSPVISEPPVFVTASPPRIANLAASPRTTVAGGRAEAAELDGIPGVAAATPRKTRATDAPAASAPAHQRLEVES